MDLPPFSESAWRFFLENARRVDNRTMFARTVALFLLACSARATSASDESWKNLSYTNKESRYSVALRDGRCVSGLINLYDDRSITLESIRLDRKNVLRVGDGSQLTDHDPIYSGRSSWSDLQASEPNKYEYIATRSETRGDPEVPQVQRDRRGSNVRWLASYKTRSGSRLLFRLAPASEWEQYAARESVPLLAPRTWFNLAFFPGSRSYSTT